MPMFIIFILFHRSSVSNFNRFKPDFQRSLQTIPSGWDSRNNGRVLWCSSSGHLNLMGSIAWNLLAQKNFKDCKYGRDGHGRRNRCAHDACMFRSVVLDLVIELCCCHFQSSNSVTPNRCSVWRCCNLASEWAHASRCSAVICPESVTRDTPVECGY